MSKVLDKSLNVLSEEIRVWLESIDLKPYSANIIGIILRQVEKLYGEDQAKSLMMKHKLQNHGWTIPKTVLRESKGK